MWVGGILKDYTYYLQSWALSVFLNFFNHKTIIFCMFYEDNNLNLHKSYLQKPTPSQINLIKNAKVIFCS